MVEVVRLSDLTFRMRRKGGKLPEFFKCDGNFDAVGSLGCVEVYVGGWACRRHDSCWDLVF